MESGPSSVDPHEEQRGETRRLKRGENKKPVRTLADQYRPINYRGTFAEKLARQNENSFLLNYHTSYLDPNDDDVRSYIQFAMDSYNRRLQQVHPHKSLQLVKVVEVMHCYELKTSFHVMQLEATDHVGNQGVYQAVVVTRYFHPKLMGLVQFYLSSGCSDVNDTKLVVPISWF